MAQGLLLPRAEELKLAPGAYVPLRDSALKTVAAAAVSGAVCRPRRRGEPARQILKPGGGPVVSTDMRPHLCLAAAVYLLGPLAAEASSLDKAMVVRVIQQRQAEYQRCYTEALGWNPGLKGRLVIRFTVDSDGEVSTAAEQTAPRFPDDVMVSCVVEQFLLMRFPPGPESFQITYPLIFSQSPSKTR